MSIVPFLMFCSLLLVAGSIVLFVVSARQGDCHEGDRMCLLPLEDDCGKSADAKSETVIPGSEIGS
jgi:hypothetical protein